MDNMYILVLWPDSQEYMDKEWFQDEAILETAGKFGSSAYFIPLARFEEPDMDATISDTY